MLVRIIVLIILSVTFFGCRIYILSSSEEEKRNFVVERFFLDNTGHYKNYFNELSKKGVITDLSEKVYERNHVVYFFSLNLLQRLM